MYFICHSYLLLTYFAKPFINYLYFNNPGSGSLLHPADHLQQQGEPAGPGKLQRPDAGQQQRVEGNFHQQYNSPSSETHRFQVPQPRQAGR